jgi:hypothetical protein
MTFPLGLKYCENGDVVVNLLKNFSYMAVTLDVINSL